MLRPQKMGNDSSASGHFAACGRKSGGDLRPGWPAPLLALQQLVNPRRLVNPHPGVTPGPRPGSPGSCTVGRTGTRLGFGFLRVDVWAGLRRSGSGVCPVKLADRPTVDALAGCHLVPMPPCAHANLADATLPGWYIPSLPRVPLLCGSGYRLRRSSGHAHSARSSPSGHGPPRY